MTFFNNLDYTPILIGVGLALAAIFIITPLMGTKPSPKDDDTTSENLSTTSENLSTTSEDLSKIADKIKNSSDSWVHNKEENLSEKESMVSDNQSVASDNQSMVSDNQASGSEYLEYEPDRVMDTVTNPTFNDPFFVDLSAVFNLDLVSHQIVAVDFIMRYVKHLDKTNRDIVREWWNTTSAMDLDSNSVLLMNEILYNFNILMSQL